jgi:hypothetical protein
MARGAKRTLDEVANKSDSDDEDKYNGDTVKGGEGPHNKEDTKM